MPAIQEDAMRPTDLGSGSGSGSHHQLQLQNGDSSDSDIPADEIRSHAQTLQADAFPTRTMNDVETQQHIVATIAQLESQIEQTEEQLVSTSAQLTNLQTIISSRTSTPPPLHIGGSINSLSNASTHEDLDVTQDINDFSSGFDDDFFSASASTFDDDDFFSASSHISISSRNSSQANNKKNTPAKVERIVTDPQAITHTVVEQIQTDTSLDISETEDIINSSRKSKRTSTFLRQSLTGSLVPKRLRKSKVKSKPPTRSAFDNVESIEAFLTDEIEMNSEMTKTGFRKLLLDQGGIHVEDALIEAIFAQTDKDGNGLLDAHELATYIHEIKPSTKNQRRKYILLSCLLYPPFYLTFLCLNASLMSATTNIREREYGDLYGKKHPYWAIASMSDLIGLCGYVILKWEQERLKYENLQQAKIRLVKWVNVDLPRFVNTTARRKLKESVSLPSSYSLDGGGNTEPDIERGEGSAFSSIHGQSYVVGNSYGLEARKIRVSFVDEVDVKEEEENVESISVNEEARLNKNKPRMPALVTHLAEGGEQLVKDTGQHLTKIAEVAGHQVRDGVTHIAQGGEQLAKETVQGGEHFMKAAGDVLKATGEQLGEAFTNIGRLGQVEFDREEAVTAIRAFLFHDKEGDAVDEFGNQGLDLQELRLLLESMGVFLADHALQEVFAEIDIDKSGSITIEELLLYATKNKQMLESNSRVVKYFGILWRCFKTIGWWTSWSYVTGAACWVTLSLIKGASFEELKALLGATCIFYLIGALGNLSNLYRSTQAQVWQIDDARMMLREAGISVGLAQKEKEDRENSTGEDSGQKERRPTIEDDVDQIQVDIRNNAFAKLEHSNDMNMRQSIFAVRSTVKTMGSNISGTSSGAKHSNRNIWQALDEETIAEAQKKGAGILFQMIDVSDDGNIDEKEFYDALVTLGVLIPSHSFSALYKAIDSDRDGLIQVSEFIDYVAKIKPRLSKRRRRLTTLYFMFSQISLYLIFVQIFAGSVQTHAALIGLSTINATKNLFVCGSFGWAVGSLYFFAVWPRSKGAFYDQMEHAKFMIKSAILEGCEIHHNAPSTKYLGNMRNGLR